MSEAVYLIDLGFSSYLVSAGRRRTRHLYKCVCGAEKEILKYSVDSGHTLSCGCKARELKRQASMKHGMMGTRVYSAWRAMRSRCSGADPETRKYYIEKGIGHCGEWEDFNQFYKDMGDPPIGFELDRVNSDEGYSPDNCRWVPETVQSRNTVLLRSSNKSGYRGVSWDKSRKKWFVIISVKGKQKNLGRFDCKIEAAKAYNAEARKHEGFPLNEV